MFAPTVGAPMDIQDKGQIVELDGLVPETDAVPTDASPGDLSIHDITQIVALEKEVCRENMTKVGGLAGLTARLGVDIHTGLNKEAVITMREKYGRNQFPESPMDSYLTLWLGALSDPVLLVLCAAAAVSLGIGIWSHGAEEGWVEGGSIFIAVFLVSNLSAFNDYSKQLQFAALEKSSADDEQCSVKRDGEISIINPMDLVVGDIIILQAGDKIPADCVICDTNVVMSSQASLTGEPEDLKKSLHKDFALYSACLITASEDRCVALVMGIGENSQWGKIKANLVVESVNTPLQEKLENMTTQIGYIGMVAAVGVFVALVIRIWAGVEPAKITNTWITDGVINAFILSVTIVVVAIPEGLPLAVTIALAYSTKKMYQDKCFIRVLAACETMGNATNICSDKTGTLTENLMTVVEGWFAGKRVDQDNFKNQQLCDAAKEIIGHHVAINRTAYLIYHDKFGKLLHRPDCIGNKTEGALIVMCKDWGYDYDEVKNRLFNVEKDKVFSFNSDKKRSTGVLHLPNGVVRLYVKGASEWILKDCTMWSDEACLPQPMTAAKKAELDALINEMADRALRTLCLSHVDFPSASALPADWQNNPPDMANLTLDCIVGIIDPLRGDVKEAVALAQAAGVTVRMVTGDNISTARAIARQCGILTDGGEAVEGPDFRTMTPEQCDRMLPNLQVMARSSPDDKHLLVTRLNGHAIPKDQAAWEEYFASRPEVKWETHKDLLLPGYREEWEKSRPNGGQVVGVTGDGTNDAPALKAADVGLAMGITGTKVAQGAADIVILDDRFSSIIQAIKWGRSVYDNIRKFLQFQLTVNVVALLLVFFGAVCGFGQPLTAVQMLWVNLIMDTMGALALATEPPVPSQLARKPYKRDSSLISRPMARNILCQSAFQLIMLFVLLFVGAPLFGVNDMSTKPCARFVVMNPTQGWDVVTKAKTTAANADITCASFADKCAVKNTDCMRKGFSAVDMTDGVAGSTYAFKFNELTDFETSCLDCTYPDYTHGTIIFNAFIWAQIFNEYNARMIQSEVNMFDGVRGNPMFLAVSIFSVGAQIFIVEIGGKITSTTHLNLNQWLITIALGSLSLIVSMAMRFIPVEEDPESFFDNSMPVSEAKASSYEPVATFDVASAEIVTGKELNP